MKKNLLLRGAEVFISRSLMHVGREYKSNGMWRSHLTNEWGDGKYLDPAIEKADKILRLALWKIQRELEDSCE